MHIEQLLSRIVLGAAMAAATVVGLPSAPAVAVAGPTAAAPPVQCVDNGTSGNRVQMLYTYEPGTSRFAEREPVMRAAAWVAQHNVNDSARRDGAQRWIRWLTGPTGCHLTINTVQVPAGSTNSGSFLDTLKSMGYNASNRVYLILAENHRLNCAGAVNDGVGNDSSPGTGNLHNSRAFWVTFQPSCFTGHTVTHELTHALGGVLPGAPHFDGGGHCADGNETLCQGTATLACPDPLAVRLLDCGRDDYFAVSPQGSYLPTHFNAALHSLYLQSGASVPALTTIPPLAPQVLRAADVEGTSIAFSWLPSMMPTGPGYSMDYQLLRNGGVVATIPGWQTTARLTGLTPNTSATYTVRHRVTIGGITRASALSHSVSVTTNSSTAPAGQAESGAVLMLTNDIVDSAGPNMAMDVFAFSEDENASIVQWPGNGLANQQWKLTSAGSGTFVVVSQHSLKCLGLLGSSVVQQACNGTASQRWTFVTLSGLTYQIRSASTNQCIQANNAGTGAGTPLVVAACSTTQPTQRWSANRIA